MLAKLFEFVVSGFRFLKVRTCVALIVLKHITAAKIKHDRFFRISCKKSIYQNKHSDTNQLIFCNDMLLKTF